MSLLVNDDDEKVFVVTAVSGERRGGFVITWVSEASLHRRLPRVVLVVSKFSATLSLMEASGTFCLQLLSEDQLEELFTFGAKSSAEVDKFPEFEHRLVDNYLELDNCAGYAYCTIEQSFETPDRKILYCRVTSERKTDRPPMVLSEVIHRLKPEHSRGLNEKRLRDAQRDEAQFPL